MLLRTCAILLLLAPQEARQPAPPDADQKAAEKIIRDLFKQQYSSKDPAVHRVVAKQMLDQSADAKSDPATRFVLLREARDQAAIGGDVAVGLKAVDDLASQFEVDAGALKLVLLDKISKTLTDPGEARSFGDVCVAAAAERVQADDYERALKILQVADVAARASKDAGLAATVRARSVEAAGLKTEYAKIKSSEKMLVEHPTDTAASGVMGRYRCFLKRDWDKGLPLLAAGPEGQEKTLATSELGKPESPVDLAALGTAWAAVAEKQSPAAKASILEHAAQCWGRAWPGADEPLRKTLREKLKLAVTRTTGRPAGQLPQPWEWVGNLKPVLDETYAKTGTYSVRVPPAQAANSSGGVCSIRFPAKPGDEFTMSGWVLTDGNPGEGDELRIDFSTSTNAFIAGDGPGCPKDQPFWKYFKHTVKCPAETANVRLMSFRRSTTGGVWLDDLSLRRTDDNRELIRNGSFEER